MVHAKIGFLHLAVYQLEEMWELIRSLPSEAVSSLVDQTRKRLSHKSPIVKQKARQSSLPFCIFLLNALCVSQ